jgi:hypothetical protein
MDQTQLAELTAWATLGGLVINGILAAITAYNVRVTRDNVQVTRDILVETQDSHQPSIYFDLEFPDEQALFVVGNSGDNSAHDIRIEVQSDVPWKIMIGGDRTGNLSSLNIVKNGISFLGPKKTLKFAGGMLDWENISDKNSLIDLQVHFKNQAGREFDRQYKIDVKQFKELMFASFNHPSDALKRPIEDIARAIRDNRPDERFKMWGRKNCPVCQELIWSSAKKCIHCHEFLPHDSVSTQSLEQEVSLEE